MKNALCRLARWGMAEQRISELEDMSGESLQTENHRERLEKDSTAYPKTMGHHKRCNIHVMGKKEKKGKEQKKYLK